MTEYQLFLVFAVVVAALFTLGLTVNILQD
jgi:hypothetical protein